MTDSDWPKLRAYFLIILLAFLLLAGRLFYLQVLHGRTLMKKSLDNLFETVEIAGPRGEILDRKGRALAKNESSFALLYLMPEDIDNYFLSRYERQLLIDLRADQIAALSALEEQEYGNIVTAVELALRFTKPMSNDELVPLLPATARASGLLAVLDGTPAEFVRDFSLRDLLNLKQCARNPGRIRLEVINALRRTGEQPYLYKWHKKEGEEQPNELKEVQRIASYLKLNYGELMKRLQKEKVRAHRYEPVTIVDVLNEDQRIYIAEHGADYPSMMIEDYAFQRVYTIGPALGSVLGYLGYPDENDPKKLTALMSGQRDMIGKQGAERAYEMLLHGRAGQRDLEVTKANAIKSIAREKAPKRGTDVLLTIDLEMQRKAHQLLAGRPGAMVVCSLQEGLEGEILALASSPSFDPSRLSESDYFEKLLNDPNKPLLNRAYGLAFHPGSTFKIVTTQAALQSGSITTGGFGCYCRGYKEIGNRRFNCHNETGHGGLNLIQSFAESCDIAFYDISTQKLDDAPEQLKHFAGLFGYGEPVGLELPGEVGGLLPDRAWKKKNYASERFSKHDRMWFGGDSANYSIGQGFLTATPLQVLWSAGIVAKDGRVFEPQLLKATQIDGSTSPIEGKAPRNVPLDKEALSFIRRAMRYTVTNGTCRKLNIPGMQVCAKSGTAEDGRRADHSWVVGYYPYDNPRYAFVSFFQNGGGAGEAAIPAMREMLLFMKENDTLKDALPQQVKASR